MDAVEFGSHYLETARSTFESMKGLAEKAIAQVPDGDLHWRSDPEANSLVVLVQHLHGNMLSRWTDFLESDGEKEWRDRDGEFEPSPNLSRVEMMQRWEEGWACVFHALQTIPPDDLLRKVAIRGQDHTLIEAIERQISHYAYHCGQIVQLARQRAGEKWMTLSIARGQSRSFVPPARS
ncbi:MAG: DUF1572 domain-containing protein [bacterium]|nr:DUF1572 domain-containing protein [bacterium]